MLGFLREPLIYKPFSVSNSEPTEKYTQESEINKQLKN